MKTWAMRNRIFISKEKQRKCPRKWRREIQDAISAPDTKDNQAWLIGAGQKIVGENPQEGEIDR